MKGKGRFCYCWGHLSQTPNTTFVYSLKVTHIQTYPALKTIQRKNFVKTHRHPAAHTHKLCHGALCLYCTTKISQWFSFAFKCISTFVAPKEFPIKFHERRKTRKVSQILQLDVIQFLNQSKICWQVTWLFFFFCFRGWRKEMWWFFKTSAWGSWDPERHSSILIFHKLM